MQFPSEEIQQRLKKKEYVDAILGSPDFFPLQNRVLNGILFSSTLVAIILEILNISVLARLASHALAISAGLGFGLLYFSSRNRTSESTLLRWTWMIILTLIVYSDWKYSGGFIGISIPIAISVIILCPAIFRGKHTFLSIGLMAITLGLMLVSDIHSTTQPPSFPNRTIFFIDHYLSALLLGCGGSLIIYLIISSHNRQQKRIESLKLKVDRLHKETVQKNIELKELNRMKDSIYAIIAHDLKSPISALSALSGLLADKSEEIQKEEQESYLKEISKSSRSVFELLNNLLVWAKSQSELTSTQPQLISLTVCVDEVIKLYKLIISKKELTLINNCRKEHQVHADPEMTSVIIRNLISNGIKFTRSGGQIRMTSEEKEQYIVLIIEDNGIGMSTDQIETIMSGQNLEGTIGTADEKGTGFGLKLVQDFVALNEGKLEITSIPNQGSTFKVYLPKTQSIDKNTSC